MAETNSFMYSEPFYTTSGSNSLKGSVGVADVTRLYYNGRQSLVSDNSLTWGALKYRNITWGADKPIKYPTVTYGYRYFWDLETSEFTVTDDFGEDTVYSPIETIKDLQVSWGVLDNVDFTKRYLSIDDLFLVSKKRDSLRPYYAEIIGSSIHNDYLAKGVQHAVFNRLASYLALDPGALTYLVENLFGKEPAETILIPNIEGLQISNRYPLDMVEGILDMHPERSEKNRVGTYFSKGQFLMIAFFAQHLLSTDNDIVYEPWMLWAAYQWYVNTVRVATNNRQIFDLSPRW